MTSLDMPGRSGGSRAARMGIPGVDLQCVQAFLFHFTKFIHAIIFKGEAQQYDVCDLIVYQRIKESRRCCST